MKHIILIYLLVYTSISNAELVTDYDDYFNTLCVESDAIGFTWKDNKWIAVKFKGANFIVKKVDMGTLDPTTQWTEFACNEKNKQSKNGLGMIAGSLTSLEYKGGCYSVKDIGSKFSHMAICQEAWVNDSKGKQYLQQVQCDNWMYFSPNGQFQKAQLRGNLQNNPTNDYKDSISLSVGSCATF